jgi:hypothetical protein
MALLAEVVLTWVTADVLRVFSQCLVFILV